MQTPGRFGIEIEMNFGGRANSYASVAALLTAAGFPCSYEGYHHQTRNNWKVVSDGSLISGCEVVSPILEGEDGLAAMKKVFEALAAAGVGVDKSTSVHAHFDTAGWRLEDFRRVLKAWCANERGLDMLVAPSRRGSSNRYCRSNLAAIGGHTLSTYDPNALIDGADPIPFIKRAYERIDTCRSVYQVRMLLNGDRYHKLNLESIERHGTIEVRLHQGSLNGDKIEHWVRLLSGLFAKARSCRGLRGQKTDRTTLSATIWRLNRMSGGNKTTYDWLYARAKELIKTEGRKMRRAPVRMPAPTPPVTYTGSPLPPIATIVIDTLTRVM